ncbi:MAG: transcriptional regulator NrdR [Chloroflexi bacterium]|nr:transcriptional regulator NrdR [Chloroflexota bacterium]MCL5075641.1 transcriptional regulator NrdR [Chloroflexota bacterium]
MQCPYCGHGDSKVVDSRELDQAIRRRRECLKCGLRFTTYERVEQARLLVVKKDGRREEFDSHKLFEGIRKACTKRPISVDRMQQLVDEIELELFKMGQPEVPSQVIGEMVMSRLRQLDEVAYVRFASVYRQFTDVESLIAEIEELREWKRRALEDKRQLELKL